MNILDENNPSNFPDFKSYTSSFTGTTNYFKRYSLFPRFMLTDGTRHIAETCGADWLFTDIAALQLYPKIRKHPKLRNLQFWELKKYSDKSARLSCSWDIGKVIYTQDYNYTNFPFEKALIYVAPSETLKDGAVLVAYLPSEH